ncbi:hypothetical protein M9H77_22490 [Catharanthus roseus]|uniref:Uncharacterized protein n=1 Tax=Catharanthus roseus TaxID=4058 RepID=A0ACC0AT60_CATRO|nr:hypothetical protein M9H77_22490 [Catharanthus roseus]
MNLTYFLERLSICCPLDFDVTSQVQHTWCREDGIIITVILVNIVHKCIFQIIITLNFYEETSQSLNAIPLPLHLTSRFISYVLRDPKRSKEQRRSSNRSTFLGFHDNPLIFTC